MHFSWWFMLCRFLVWVIFLPSWFSKLFILQKWQLRIMKWFGWIKASFCAHPKEFQMMFLFKTPNCWKPARKNWSCLINVGHHGSVFCHLITWKYQRRIKAMHHRSQILINRHRKFCQPLLFNQSWRDSIWRSLSDLLAFGRSPFPGCRTKLER